MIDEKQKPGEWFLYKSVSDDEDTMTAVPRGNDPHDQYANMVTVIEKSCYDALKAENERFRTHAEAMAASLYSADRRTPGQRKALIAYRKDFPK